MVSQAQAQHPVPLENLRGKVGSYKRWIIAALAIFVALLWILSSLGIFSIVWSSVFSAISSMVGVVTAFQQPAQSSHTQSFVFIPTRPLPFTDKDFTYFNEAFIKQIYNQIIASKATVIVLSGSPGIGKSTLAAQVYSYAEKRRLEGDTTFKGEAVWSRVDPSLTMSELSKRLLRNLGKPIPNFDHLPPQNQALAVSHALSTSNEARLVFLDQFENLLEWGRSYGFDGRPGVEELLYDLGRQNPNSRLIVTSDTITWKENEDQLSHLEAYQLIGFDESQSLEFLKQQLKAAAAKMGLKDQEVKIETDDPELKRIIAGYRGNALALKLLASILIHDDYLNPKEAVHVPGYAEVLERTNAAQLLDYIYHQQLNRAEQQLLLAFSIYREPVDLAAAQAAIIAPDIAVSEETIESLLSHSVLLPAEPGRFYLHPVVTNFARKHFNETDEKANQKDRQEAHGKAAQHYRKLANPDISQGGRLPANRLHLLVEATWHLCRAEKFVDAYKLMEDEKLFSKLTELGHNAILLELYQLFLPLNRWNMRRHYSAYIYNNLGEVYAALEKRDEARENFEQALPLFIEEQNRVGEARVKHNLGAIYSDLGQELQLWGYLEQSWDFLFPSLQTVEEEQLFLKYHKQSIEAEDLLKRAMGYLEQASAIRKDEGEYHGLCKTLYQLGRVYKALKERELAFRSYRDALDLSHSVEDQLEEGRILQDLGSMYNAIGGKERARALDYLEQARRIQVEQQELLEEGNTLNSLGYVYDGMGEKQRAWRYYWRALTIGQQVGDRKLVAIALHNIGAIYFPHEPSHKTLEQMLAFLLLAKDIFQEIHSPLRERAERQIEVLREKVNQADEDKNAPDKANEDDKDKNVPDKANEDDKDKDDKDKNEHGKNKFDRLVAATKPKALTKVKKALEEGFPKESAETSAYISFTQSNSQLVGQKANTIIVGAVNMQNATSAGGDKEVENKQEENGTEGDQQETGKEKEDKQEADDTGEEKQTEVEN